MYTFKEKEHVHLLDGQPLYGTTTVIKEVMPPFLAKWGAQCAVDYVSENIGEIFEYPLETKKIREFLDEAVMAWSKVRSDAAEKGTLLHGDLERYVQLMIDDHDGRPHQMNDDKEGDENWRKVRAFAEWAVKNVEQFIFAEKYTYSKSLWVGGVVDCLARMKNGKLAVIDFKSNKEAFFNHFVQAAGYARQLEEGGYGNADGTEWKHEVWRRTLPDGDWNFEPIKIGELIVIPFGSKTLRPVIVENVDGFKDAFSQVASIYPLLQAFRNK